MENKEQNTIRFEVKATNPKQYAPSYQITTFKDMVMCVPPEDADKFLKEFSVIFHSMMMVKATGADMNQFDFGTFTWTND